MLYGLDRSASNRYRLNQQRAWWLECKTFFFVTVHFGTVSVSNILICLKLGTLLLYRFIFSIQYQIYVKNIRYQTKSFIQRIYCINAIFEIHFTLGSIKYFPFLWSFYFNLSNSKSECVQVRITDDNLLFLKKLRSALEIINLDYPLEQHL